MDFGPALTGLFWFITILIGVSVFLAIYVIATTLFLPSSWDVCSQLTPETAIIQCMKVYN